MFIHFQNATCGHAISNKELEIRKQYLIHKIDKVNTKYGISVLATIKLDTSVTRVFFTRRYVQTFTERNIMDINPSSVRVCLIYHGTCWRSSALFLALQAAEKVTFSSLTDNVCTVEPLITDTLN
jgi:hypothetical protein